MSFIADQISRLMFNPANSCPPRSPTQTRAQRQQQLQYPASTTICSIQLHDNDRIRLINAPSSLIPLLRHTIASTWNQPILQEISKVYCGTYEFWVGGKPWAPSLKTGPSLTSTNLVLAMRRAMEEVGWSLILASNMSRVREENDSLFFEWTGGFPARPWLSFHHQQQLPVQVQEKDTNRGPWLSTQQQQQQQQQVPLQEKDADQMTLVSDVSGHKNAEHLTLHEAAAAATPAGVESFTVEFFGYDTIRVPTDVPIAILTALRLAILRHWTQGYAFHFVFWLLLLGRAYPT